MTRFARAKGSKSSNEKAPEDSTPWEVMKDQLMRSKHENEEAKAREQAEKKRIENYENFLKEQKVQKRKATWCDFPETENKLNAPVNEQQIKKKKQNKEVGEVQHIENNNNSSTDKETRKSKKKKNKNKEKSQVLTNSKQHSQENKEDAVSPSPEKTSKKKKNKAKNASKESTDVQENSIIENESKLQKNTPKKKKNKKLVDGKPLRRKADDNSFQLIINGKEVVLVRYDGFPVMKKDAERLDDLKKSMMQKGIPKSEVQRTMKLERRRAEKALARLKREVCYNCRKGGHNLSDCPDLKSKIPGADAAEGVCFKCGSTEHRQFECKVQRDKEFRFATCFICKEPGHIARQCPDNPKGLYPNGGCCKLCGDVTHLRKDCPTVSEQKTESSIKLNTLHSDGNLEDIGKQANVIAPAETSKKPKKIKF